jgi:hypothetical protein
LAVIKGWIAEGLFAYEGLCYMELVHSVLPVAGWINSAINPFIYAFYSPDFRIAFWRLTFRHCSTPRSPPDLSLRLAARDII